MCIIWIPFFRNCLYKTFTSICGSLFFILLIHRCSLQILDKNSCILCFTYIFFSRIWLLFLLTYCLFLWANILNMSNIFISISLVLSTYILFNKHFPSPRKQSYSLHIILKVLKSSFYCWYMKIQVYFVISLITIFKSKSFSYKNVLKFLYILLGLTCFELDFCACILKVCIQFNLLYEKLSQHHLLNSVNFSTDLASSVI